MTACRKPPAPTATAEKDAAAPVVVVVDASAPPPAPAAVVEDAGAASAKAGGFELVAAGVPVLSLKVVGTRVWFSGKNVDAYADEDGPLVKGADLLKGLPYQWGRQRVTVVGEWPKLVALRTTATETRADSPESTAFVYVEGAWKQVKPLSTPAFPHGFVPWNDGALIVHSQIAFNAQATYFASSGDGTTFDHVAYDGTVTRPKLAIPKSFMAWDAASDGATLTLLGTKGSTRPDKEPTSTEDNLTVVRGKVGGPFAVSTVVTGLTVGMESFAARVLEDGAGSVVVPPHSTTAEVTGAWKPDATTFWLVGDGKPAPRRVAEGDSCMVSSAARTSEALYAVLDCVGETPARTRLVKSTAARTETVTLPAVARGADGRFALVKSGPACEPVSVVVRARKDLWVEATCGTDARVPVVFRAGHPQTPIGP